MIDWLIDWASDKARTVQVIRPGQVISKHFD